MSESMPIALFLAPILGLCCLLFFYVGRQVRDKQRINYIAWYRTDRVQDTAGFSRWIGQSFVIQGYITLLAAIIILVDGITHHYNEAIIIFDVWFGLFIAWFIVVAIGTRRFYSVSQ